MTTDVEAPWRERLDRARELVRELRGGVVVAFSGGVDSALLLRLFADALPGRVLAVTADSESYPDVDRTDAIAFARSLGVPHLFVRTHELENEAYRKNDANRCYFCKRSLFETLAPLARERGLDHLAFGANADDEGDFRPGHRAAHEFAVRAPLLDAGLTKADVRAASRELGLTLWDKPASACLASRIPYGTAIDETMLRQVEHAETALRALGLRQVRVRHHGDVARIELGAGELERALAELRAQIVAGVRAAGFAWVTLDLDGYVHGSLNRLLREPS
ncbi:MAG: ATP-dependent sacrificial sulfur transferase LarE [Planctomycetes bacterium]|nr:ATP-dependent sacrificial sulfur transferase LarE [Planctomycetota bacterium]